MPRTSNGVIVDPKIEKVGSSIESLVQSLIKSGFKIEKVDSKIENVSPKFRRRIPNFIRWV